jgi:hypothetical protein
MDGGQTQCAEFADRPAEPGLRPGPASDLAGARVAADPEIKIQTDFWRHRGFFQ